MDINDNIKREKPQTATKNNTKSKTKLSKAGKSLKNLVRVLENVLVFSPKVLKRGKSNATDTPDILASEKLAFVPANASTTPPRFPAITRTNKENEGGNEGSTLSAAMNGAVEALRSVVDRPSNSNVVGIIQDVAKSFPVTSTQQQHPAESTTTKTSSSFSTTKPSGQPVDSTLSISATTGLTPGLPSIVDIRAPVSEVTSTPTATSTTLSTARLIDTPGASSSIPGVPENANTADDQETETDGKKKKNKKSKKKKRTNKLNPSQLVEQAVEFSPKAMELVKRGMNNAVAIIPTSGPSSSSNFNNAISNAMASAVNGTGSNTVTGTGTSKMTDTLMLKRKEFDTIIPVGPVAFLLKGNIDRTDLSIDASFNVKIGFITHKLGKVVGNLKTGVRIKFGLSGVLTGQATFYMPLKKVKGKGKGKAGKAEREALNNGQDGKEGGNGEVMKDAERSKWLWLDIKVTVFKEDIGPLSLPLIPLRFGHAKSTSDALSISTLTEHLLVEDTRSGTRRSIEVTHQSITISRQSVELDAYCSTVAMARHSIDETFIEVWHDDTNPANVDDTGDSEWGCEGFAVGYHS